MTFPFASLPPELISKILRLVEVEDVAHIAQLIPILASTELYEKVFPDSTRFSRHDTKAFQERLKAKLYVVGGDECYKHSYNSAYESHYEPVKNGKCCRMHTPWKVESKGPIRQVSFGESTVVILNCEGEIHLARVFPNNVHDVKPYTVERALTREPVMDDWDKGRHREWCREKRRREERRGQTGSESDPESDSDYPPDYDDALFRWWGSQLVNTPLSVAQFSEKWYAEPYKKPHITRIASCVETFASDRDGNLWKWSHMWEPDPTPLQGTPLCILHNGTLVKGNALKCGEYSCLIEGTGVVLLWPQETTTPNGVRSGFPCLDEHFCWANVRIVPGTEHLKDYVPFDDYVAYLKRNGFMAVIPYSEIVRTPNVDNVNIFGPFVQLAGSDTALALLTKSGQVVTVYNQICRRVDGITDVVSVAAGSDHFLALTDSGDVYSWGSEFDMNGCLGLGRLEDALKMKHVRLENRTTLTADKPIKLELPGKAYGIFAHESCSGFLIYEDEK